MPFPLVSENTDRIPTKKEILDAMETVQSIKAAQHLLKRVELMISHSNYIKKSPDLKETADNLIAAVKEFVRFVEYKYTPTTDSWGGVPPKSSFACMQDGIAHDAMNQLQKDGLKKVKFDFAIKENGQFVCAYATDEQGTITQLGGDTVGSLDRLLNSWLADKTPPITTADGFFYVKDAAGNQRQLSAEEVDEIMANSAKDFKDYLHNFKDGGIELISRQCEYPGEKRLEEKIKAAKAKAMEALAAIPEEAAEIEPEAPEAPSTGMS